VAQLLEPLPSKCETLNSNPSTIKKKFFGKTIKIDTFLAAIKENSKTECTNNIRNENSAKTTKSINIKKRSQI
jgi:hypothetical protein